MSRTLSTNSGSVDSLNVSARCGCSPKAVQIRRIVVCEKAGRTCHRADRPVGRVSWPRAQRPLNHGGDLLIVDRPGTSWSGFVQQALDTIPQEAPAPFADRVLVHSQLGSDDLAWDPISAAQDDPASLRHRARHPPATDLPLQILALVCLQN